VQKWGTSLFRVLAHNFLLKNTKAKTSPLIKILIDAEISSKYI
jgi:hypothetical protein